MLGLPPHASLSYLGIQQASESHHPLTSFTLLRAFFAPAASMHHIPRRSAFSRRPLGLL